MSQEALSQRKPLTYENDLAKRKNNEEGNLSQEEESGHEDEERHSEDPNEEKHDGELNEVPFEEQFHLDTHKGNVVSERVAEEEVPTDKDKLIAYLQHKLVTAEMSLNTIFVAIQMEREKRDQLMIEVEDKKQELHEVNGAEDNFLAEKVQEQMTSALEKAVEDRVIAEDEKAQLDEELVEKEFKIQELDENVRMLHERKKALENAIDDAQYRVNEQESMIQNFGTEITRLDEENAQKEREIGQLIVEIDDMNYVLRTLSEMREKLNYYIPKESDAPVRRNSRTLVQTPKKISRAGLSTDLRKSQVGESGDLDKTPKRTYPKDDDFWYEMPTGARVVKTPQSRKGISRGFEGVSTEQKLNVAKSSNFQTIEYRPIQPTVKLPYIKKGNQELLYKKNEYMEEMQGGRSKNPFAKSPHVKGKAF